MGVGLRIRGRGSPGARLGALGQKTVDKKTDLFGEGAENGSVGAKGLGKKTDLFGSGLGGQGPGNPRAPFDSALREPASPAPAGQIQTKHGHR
jgi:hypothetical protein